MAKFLNRYEQITYEKLRIVADKVGAHVFSKVRLADVISINNSGISSKDFNYALKAHVDFLVTNAIQEPQFCVEFDGPTHRKTEQIQRDEIKNALLGQFNMPYIRINDRYLESRYRDLDLLTYFVDVWFLCEAFNEAQNNGQIPEEEIFDPSSIYSSGRKGGHLWPYWLSLDPQLKIQKLYRDGKIVQMAPCHWIGADKRGASRCIAWLHISTKECVVIETGMRKHLFPAIISSELLSQLAIFDLYDQLTLVLEGRGKPTSATRLQTRLAHYKAHFQERSSASCSFITDPLPR